MRLPAFVGPVSRLLLAVVALEGCAGSATPVAPEPLASGAAPLAILPALADASPACSPDAPRAVPLRVFTEPEAGLAPILEPLSRAETSIRVMVYELGPGPVLEGLERKARSGVRVRVILDRKKTGVNQRAFDRLGAAGAKVAWSSARFPYMHAKTLVVDDALAVISTGNFVPGQLATARNYVVHDADPEDVRCLLALFDGDWAGDALDIGCTRLLVSPVNARERLVALIDSAKATVDVESMELSDAEVRDALFRRRSAGVDVRVILADPGWVIANARAAKLLKEHGIAVRTLKRPAVHVKAVAIDGERAYLGSVNLSRTSLRENREVGVIAHEPEVLETMATTFVRDWAAAEPW